MIFTIKLNEDEIRLLEIALISKITKEEKSYAKDLISKLEELYVIDKRY